MPDQFVCPECAAASPIPGTCSDCGLADYVPLEEDAVIPAVEGAGEEVGKYKPKDLETPVEVDEDDLTMNLKNDKEKEEE